MMFDLHTHTTFSDGENTPEEMILGAIGKGLDMIGFSDHAYTSFDLQYCMSKDRLEDYRREILALKEKYRGKIKVLLGIEQDYYSDFPAVGYDYIIGSVHYLKAGNTYFPVDENAEILSENCRRFFGGDFYALAEAYFAAVADVVNRTKADIIGHFDLIRKYNRGGALFDENHPRYQRAAKAAIDKLLTYGVPFEINTGAMFRGCCNEPYPALNWVRYIKEQGGTLIYTGDAHCVEALCYGFGQV